MADPSQQIYDPNEDLIPEDQPEPQTQPYLKSVPGTGTSDGVPRGQLSSVPDNKGSSPEELANQEEAPSRTTSAGNKLTSIAGGLAGAEAGAAAIGASDTLGKGFTGAEKPAKVKQLVSGTFKNKALLGVGGGAGIVALVGLLFFGGITSYALVTIEKTMIKDLTKVEQHFVKESENSAMNEMLCRQTSGRLGKACDGEEDDETAAEKATEDSSGELAKEIDDTSLTNPELDQYLKQGGVKVESTDGEVTAVDNPEGQNIADELTTDNTDLANFDNIAWTLDQRQEFVPLLVDQADVSFVAWPDTNTDNIKETYEDEVQNGANNAEDVAADAEASEQATGETQPAQPTPAEIAAEKTATTAEETANGPLADGIEAAEKVDNQTHDATAALQAGEDAVDDALLDGGDALLATSTATEGCEIISATEKASDARVGDLMELATREGGTEILAGASQLESGHETSTDVNQAMELLAGNPSAPRNKDGTPSEASEPFDDSASWHRETGQSVGSNNPDISAAVLPEENAGNKIVDEIKSVMKQTHTNLACSTLTSPFGTVITGIVGGATVIGDIASFGALQAGITLANVAFVTSLNKVVCLMCSSTSLMSVLAARRMLYRLLIIVVRVLIWHLTLKLVVLEPTR